MDLPLVNDTLIEGPPANIKLFIMEWELIDISEIPSLKRLRG